MTESSDNIGDVTVQVAPGNGRVARRPGMLLFDPTGEAVELVDRFAQASAGDDAITAVKHHLIDAAFSADPLVVVDWRSGDLGLFVFGDIDVHSSAVAAPMISGAGSRTWIERNLGALELGGESEAQVWCGDETDANTDLQHGVVRTGGVRLEMNRVVEPAAAAPVVEPAPEPVVAETAPEPVAEEPAAEPAPEPVAAEPEPEPEPEPAPEPVAEEPVPEPVVEAAAPPMPPPPMPPPPMPEPPAPPAPPEPPASSLPSPPPPPPPTTPPPAPVADEADLLPPPPPASNGSVFDPVATNGAAALAAPVAAGYVADQASLDWTDTQGETVPPAPPASDPFSDQPPPPPSDELAPPPPPAGDVFEAPAAEAPADVDAVDPVVESAGVGLVEATTCLNGHSNPVGLAICRACAVEIHPEAEVTLIAQPAAGHIRFADGTAVEIDKPHVIGRKPTSEPGTQPIIIEHAEVSRSHLTLTLDGWNVLVTDLGSRNGTWVIPPSDPTPLRLDAQVPYLLEHGTAVHLGGPEASFSYDFGTD